MEKIAANRMKNFAIKSYSVEHGYPSRRRSLVVDAKFETLKNREAKLSWLKESREVSQDYELSEEEVLVEAQTKATADLVDASAPKLTNLMITLHENGFADLPRVLKLMQAWHGEIEHIETRRSEAGDAGAKKTARFDVFFALSMPTQGVLGLMKALRQANLGEVSILREKLISMRDPWFPRHIGDLDYCTHIITKYEPELDHDHPGFNDKAYIARRNSIANIAFEYRYGRQIPRVQYTSEEINTWGVVYKQLVKLFPTHASAKHIEVFHVLEKECGYAPDNIPQLEDVSLFLKKRTGFTIRPAAGLLTARDFLASLSFRVFQTTQYIRHASNPHHSPEPDCVHELLGHIPILADESFADFSQEIGLASLGASDEEIEKLATLYWFTVEFGLCRENGKIKAYGAGLLSSYGELEHCLSDVPERREFEPALTAIQPYQDQDYQSIYYVAESFDDAKSKFRKWVADNLPRRFEVYYDAFTDRILVLDSIDNMDRLFTHLSNQLHTLKTAAGKLKN